MPFLLLFISFARDDRFPLLKDRYEHVTPKPKNKKKHQTSPILQEILDLKEMGTDKRKERLKNFNKRAMYKEEIITPGPGEYDVVQYYQYESVI